MRKTLGSTSYGRGVGGERNMSEIELSRDEVELADGDDSSSDGKGSISLRNIQLYICEKLSMKQ
jgi:hypothetical protein